ncbi:MAG: flavin reductase domain protein FMN-binding protein [Pseudonocardiales bacterium]|nr:flavin reductase domain protein FMN-binding protein [Pseudonocardiales bacterium]
MIHADMGRLDVQVLREAYGTFPSGVTALCALVDGSPVGMAASSFTSVSMDPPLVSICVANTSSTWVRLKPSTRLGVSVLAAAQEGAARQLSAKAGDRFAGLGLEVTDEGAVLIEGSAAWLDCTLFDEIPAGDHTMLLLRIEALRTFPEQQPLVFHGSAFRQLAQ